MKSLLMVFSIFSFSFAEDSKQPVAVSSSSVSVSTAVPNPWDPREEWVPMGTQKSNLRAFVGGGKNWTSVVLLFVNETAYQKKDGSLALVLTNVNGESLAMLYNENVGQLQWALKVGNEWVAAKEPGFESLRTEAVLDENHKPV